VLKAYGGHWAKVVRASQSGDDYVRVELPHAYLTLCVFAQPHYHDLLADSQLLATSGLIGRCIVDVVDAPGKIPWSAPPVPKNVQEDYDAWLLGLAEGDVPEVVDLGADAECREALEDCYERVEADGSGTSQRIVGRVARIVAIGAVAAGVPPRAYRRGILDLFKLIYLDRLRQVNLLDQPTDDLSRLARGALLTGRARRQPGVATTVRELQRHYCERPRPRTEDLYRALDELANAGYCEWDQESKSMYRGRLRYRSVVFHHRPEPTLTLLEGSGVNAGQASGGVDKPGASEGISGARDVECRDQNPPKADDPAEDWDRGEQ
jgi:hypothetical protein